MKKLDTLWTIRELTERGELIGQTKNGCALIRYGNDIITYKPVAKKASHEDEYYYKEVYHHA